ncbi:MAG: LysR family transcriptional regulator [Hyphomicrobiales bacterium]|nr:MAG: LysR family transcriptional regulator [Hyphomicrobiales bacterium]
MLRSCSNYARVGCDFAGVGVVKMNWDDLQIIAAVSRHQSFAGAALETGLDQTTVSRRLTRIQKQLDQILFEAKNGIRVPTPYCETILARIQIMEREARAIGLSSDSISKPTGHVRLAMTSALAEEILAPYLADFLGNNSGICLELQSSDRNVNFSKWEADLAIRLGKPERGAFLVRKLADLSFYLFKPRNQNAATSHTIMCAYPDELDQTPEMRALSQWGLRDSVQLKTASTRIIRSIIKSRNGVGILPGFIAGDLLDDKSFVVTRLEERRECWLLIQPHLKEDDATRQVIDWIDERFKSCSQL